ncbi:class I adenylate-forming enzyme family protein [Bordetella petrii]|uniref:class I adenylate-forming enzyme family protein n=1 Tax=Bordetella petrii TaxID=94624 RepID=UPI001E3BAAE3|nr:AMP-binding protein [Bordetella petrii]MCD0504656.1 AMP-binding protein [Bordetella petrii]
MITDLLYAHAAKSPGQPFLVVDGREYSYSDMARLVSAVARHLHGHGVRPGSRVAMLCGNRPAFLAAWFAIGELGAVAVPLNTGLKGDGLRYILAQSGSVALLIEPALLQALSADLDAMESCPQCLEIGDWLEAIPQQHVPRWLDRPAPAPMAANSILYTSGTTGLPKGAVLPHSAYQAAGRDMARSLGLAARDRIMVFLPLFHANPQMYAVASALHTGATLVLRPRFSASAFFDDAVRFQATGFTYVGTVLAILDKQHPGKHTGHGLRWGVGGGAPERVWRDIAPRFGFAVCELYGMTETGGWVSMNTAGATRMGTVGRARPGVTLAVRDERGSDVPQGTQGEIVAHASPGMFFTEYWNNPQATASTLRQEWLHTGDRGSLDADGYLTFHGRIKELIRRGGEMIAPVEIEMRLLQHPDIRECAVIGVPDDIMGEEIQAVLVARRNIPADQLREFVAATLPAHMVPRYAVYVDSLPKTETEKIKRHELAKLDAPVQDLRARG